MSSVGGVLAVIRTKPLVLALAAALGGGTALLAPGMLQGGHANATTASSLWSNSTRPAIVTADDPHPVELGMKFVAANPGAVSGVRFYKGPRNTGTHVGSLWSYSGQRLASVTFSNETTDGWQTARFARPVQISAHTRYVVSYYAPRGYYSATNGYFVRGKGNGQIWAPPASAVGGNGVYRYGASAFPGDSYKATNYWVDLLFTPASSTSPVPTATATPTRTATGAPTVSPTRTSTPTATPTTTTPAPLPTTTAPTTSTGFPGPGNTGVPAGTTLTAYTGPHTITTAGTVIDGKDVSGSLVISARNVVIKNSKVHDDPGATAGIYVTDSGSATITNTEIYNFQVGLTYGNFTATRINLHDTTFDGIKMSSNATLRDSWIHGARPSSDAHWDGIQVQNGVVNTLIQHNTIDSSASGTNSALFLCPDLGPTTSGPLTVTDNKLNGGNYTVFVLDGNNGQYFIHDISLTNNRFGNTFQYGHADVNVPITQSGNVVDATGAPLTL